MTDLGVEAAGGSRLRTKTWLFAALVVAANAFGNLFLDFGVHGEPTRLLGWTLPYHMPWLIAGIVLLIVWMLSRMTLLSWADLTFVLPVTAVGYVISALFGWLFLHEQVSGTRWIGTLFIFAGVALVGRTNPQTETAAKPEQPR